MFGILCVLFDLGRAGVHRATNIRIPFQVGLFVLYGTAVQLFQQAVSFVEVHSVSGLIP